MTSVLITGAAGFLGRHVVEEAARQDAALRLMSHRRPAVVTRPGCAVVCADLRDPDSLRGVCEGIDVVMHCASYIGGSVQNNEFVNAQGTRNLVAEARRAGVSRVVYVSTASVYGRGSFCGATPAELTRNPGSPTSASRAAAEDAVLDAGGLVLRPHLVYGVGDAWVVPGVSRLLRALPGTVEGWSARLSLVSVHELARLAVAAGLAPAADLTAMTYHASHPDPVTAATLLRAVADCAELPWPQRDLTALQACGLLASDPRSLHALDMLRTDHFFDSAPLWRDLRLTPGPGFASAFAQAAPWYRSALSDASCAAG
ncbi:NAD-dependent epimerase/dehydratase family protein [Streptacidiphilus neutrinimicus]|uniref:NAD-dependent epimerase/dehydratase family protein n=1 Tax=Streptacidiphilus neutrinimicus TaxID=105420 RepID=UPI0005A82291|nr:NAD-dependent epimerase/dehydratase family protein [Streptacidiphilus neutrinimicus]